MSRKAERREFPRETKRQRIFKKMKSLAKAVETLAWAVKNHTIVGAASNLTDTIKQEYS